MLISVNFLTEFVKKCWDESKKCCVESKKCCVERKMEVKMSEKELDSSDLIVKELFDRD